MVKKIKVVIHRELKIVAELKNKVHWENAK